jgi:hypothetical protein
MSENVENLILEQLRQLRGEIGGLSKEMGDRFATLSQRIDGLENEVRGMSYVVTATLGSMLAELKEIKERVGHLEKA